MSRCRIALALLFFCPAVFGAEKAFDFSGVKPGELPAGFRALVGGSESPAPGEWRVIEDVVPSVLGPLLPQLAPSSAGNRRPVVAQLSRDRTDERFPMLIYEGEIFGDFTVTTRFKIVDGAEEQMAGLAFRLQDERNYYYVRASALGNTFNFFKILDGQRQAPIGSKVEIKKGVWQKMTVECKGTRIRAWLNDQEAFPPLDDKSFNNGKIGFWTKSDAVSYFTDTVIDYKPRENLAVVLVKEALEKYPRLLGLKIYAADALAEPMRIVASMEQTEVGQAAPKEAEEVLEKRGYYYGKSSGTVMLTLPLRDHNGDKVAAVRVVMKTFPGQTEKNALARAMPVVHGMETRIQTLKDLTQ